MHYLFSALRFLLTVAVMHAKFINGGILYPHGKMKGFHLNRKKSFKGHNFSVLFNDIMLYPAEHEII